MESTNDKQSTGIRSRVPRLLLVDDEPMLQFTLRLMLEEFFEVEVADSGHQAQTVIDAQPHFDVVLEVMKECLKDGETPKYAPINNHEFLMQRLREIGLKAG